MFGSIAATGPLANSRADDDVVSFGESLRTWRSNRFLRSVGVLVGGTAFAQGILALALPVVTRLFSPADFSILAVFTGIVTIASVAACLRFEVAIPIPKSNVAAANILALALAFPAVVALVIAIVIVCIGPLAAEWLNQPRLAPYLWLVPIGVLLAGGSSALQFWFARKKDFTAIARARIGQSCAVAGTQLGCGWAGIAPGGLLYAQLLNAGGSCVGLGYRVARDDRALLRGISLPRMRAMFRAYDRFPKYSTLEALSNAAQGYLPLIMIAALVSGPEAGYLTLAMYAVQAPMGLLGGAVSQVYLSRAAEEHRAQRLGPFTTTVLGGLLRSGVGPVFFAGLIAPAVFAIVFGEPWRRAGDLVTWMTPWFILQFLSFPLSMALPVTHNQRASLALQVFGLVSRVLAVQAAALWFPWFIAESYALSGFVAYVAYLAVVLHVVGAKREQVMKEVKGSLPFVLLWLVAGAVIAAALGYLFPAVPVARS